MEQWLSPFSNKLTGTLKIICTLSSCYLFTFWSAEAIPGRQVRNTFWTRFVRILIINVSGCEDAFSATDPLIFHMPQFPWYAFCVAEIIPLTTCVKKPMEFCIWTGARITSDVRLKCWRTSLNFRFIKINNFPTNFHEVHMSLLLNNIFQNGLRTCFFLLLISTAEWFYSINRSLLLLFSLWSHRDLFHKGFTLHI